MRYDIYIYRLVAHEMAAMHDIDAKKITGQTFNEEPATWRKSQQFLNETPDKYTKPELNKRYHRFTYPKEVHSFTGTSTHQIILL